jgi:hypothetical protein
VEHWARNPLSLWPNRVRHGRCWFQGQVVRVIPRHYAQYLQRRREQLVECALCSPCKRLPQVRSEFLCLPFL